MASNSAAPKKYGLIVPKKSKGVALSTIKKPSVFEDSSSDEETPSKGGRTTGKAANSSLWRENKKNALQMESHGSVLKALEDDPTVFEYDSLYDDMQEQKKQADPRLAKKDKNSRYIAKLKKVADRRKIEQDIIYERKVQREMEAEGLEYGDKDTFLTSAYRLKLEERKKMEEELKEEARKEEAQDVKKQVDMSRFHRNLLERITDPSSRKEGGEEGREERNSSDRKPSRVSEEEEEEEEDTERKKESEGRREGRDRESEDQSRREGDEDQNEGDQNQRENENQRQKESEDDQSEGDQGQGNQSQGDQSQGSPKESEAHTLFPPTIDKEGKRKAAAVKRTNEETLGSARERYLARKKAKLTAPVISDD